MISTHVFESHQAEEAQRIATREVRKVHDGKARKVSISRSYGGFIIIRTYTDNRLPLERSNA